uniref:NADH dehydrogenase [ubiquinone] 1 subunit C2 n=1 Tax=Salvator merianae TaxID=96440 RepID=A0A8D0BJW1_SALMN
MAFRGIEARALPPPPLFTFGSLACAFMGWSSALIENALRLRPVLYSGVHRQLLGASLGLYVGYYLVKRANYQNAMKDRDIAEYIRHHPEDFPEKGRDFLEKFRPVR